MRRETAVKAVEILDCDKNILMLMDLSFTAEDAGPLAPHGNRKERSETVAYK